MEAGNFSICGLNITKLYGNVGDLHSLTANCTFRYEDIRTQVVTKPSENGSFWAHVLDGVTPKFWASIFQICLTCRCGRVWTSSNR